MDPIMRMAMAPPRARTRRVGICQHEVCEVSFELSTAGKLYAAAGQIDERGRFAGMAKSRANLICAPPTRRPKRGNRRLTEKVGLAHRAAGEWTQVFSFAELQNTMVARKALVGRS